MPRMKLPMSVILCSPSAGECVQVETPASVFPFHSAYFLALISFLCLCLLITVVKGVHYYTRLKETHLKPLQLTLQEQQKLRENKRQRGKQVTNDSQ